MSQLELDFLIQDMREINHGFFWSPNATYISIMGRLKSTASSFMSASFSHPLYST